jgi:hypothetical protein
MAKWGGGPCVVDPEVVSYALPSISTAPFTQIRQMALNNLLGWELLGTGRGGAVAGILRALPEPAERESV